MSRFTRITCKSREEWLQNRTGGIGGSGAAAIIGLNPWKTNVEYWEETLGLKEPEDISAKPVVKYGLAAEEHLRELLKLDFPQFEVYHSDYEVLTFNKLPFLRASLDGEINVLENCIFEGQALTKGMRGVLEIKTTEVLNSMSRENWKNAIPQNYYCQVLHYLFITNYDFAIVVAQLKYDYQDSMRKSTQHYIVMKKDKIGDIKYLINAEVDFWNNYVLTKTKPALILNNTVLENERFK